MTIKLLSITALTLLAAGCSKADKKSEPAPSAKSAEPKAAEPKAAAGPFGNWDMDARRAAFAGAHVTPGDSAGTWQAWQVDGDKVTIWNGSAEKTYELALESPCSARVTERGDDGSSSSTTTHYTIKNGAVVMGLGDAGARSGGEAIACVSNKIVTLDAAGVCSEWELDVFGDKWARAAGTCAFVKDGDKEWLSVTIGGHESRLVVDGDVILSEQLVATHSEKAADFAAAKTARDQK